MFSAIKHYFCAKSPPLAKYFAYEEQEPSYGSLFSRSKFSSNLLLDFSSRDSSCSESQRPILGCFPFPFKVLYISEFLTLVTLITSPYSYFLFLKKLFITSIDNAGRKHLNKCNICFYYLILQKPYLNLSRVWSKVI